MKFIFYSFLALFSIQSIAQKDRSHTEIGDDDTLRDNTPVFVAILDEPDASQGDGNISGLLQSSRDVFAYGAGFNLSASRFRIRGYQVDKTSIFINGVPVSDATNGSNIWHRWGGLNDITRNSETKNGLIANPYHFGGIGGYSNINAKASAIRKGHRISYANANRDFHHRLMYTYGTGMMANGWAFAVSVSGRYAYEGFVEGTYYKAFSYFASAEKKINEHQRISFSVLGAPREIARSNASVEEVYNLSGDVYHNSSWGWQTMPDGTAIKRSANIARENLPFFILSHENKINEKTKWVNSALFSIGKTSKECLNWYDAKDPRPDYYRYLPSYYESINDEANAKIWRDRWTSNNQDYTQINWNQLYQTNNSNLYTQQDANGVAGNSVNENQWDNKISLSLSSTLNKSIRNLDLTAGLYYQFQRDHHYKTISDLLGGDFWVDVSQNPEQTSGDSLPAQNNLATPNHIIKAGNVFGYNYFIYNHELTGFAQAQFKSKHIDFYTAVELSDRIFYRDGVFQNERFPNDSKGKSTVNNFFNYAVKGGVVLKVTGRQLFTLNGAFMTEAPTSSNAYISPETRNHTASDLQNEDIYTWDVNYIICYPKLKMRATFYQTERKNAILSRSFYNESYRSNVNYLMQGVNYRHQGVEFGIDANVVGGLNLNGLFAWSQHLYNSRPTANAYIDNSTEKIKSDELIYLKNYCIGGMPQSAFSLGLKYAGKHCWFLGANFNYFMDVYLDPNPDRRTANAVTGFLTSDPQWNKTIDQTKLKNGYNLTFYSGKSFRINEKHISLYVSITNLTNNRLFVTGGYEQLRFDPTNINKFPPKVVYMYGLNYFIMATFSF